MYGYIYAGDVEYDKRKAAVDIDELIEALEAAKEDGVTDIVGLSGNYRGAQYVRLSADIHYGYEEDEF